MTERFCEKAPKIIKGLIALAKENNLPFSEVMKKYNDFNYIVYEFDLAKGGEFKIYKPELEDKTLKLTERYYVLKKTLLNDFGKN